MAYEVHLSQFDGPLDLLLHLIEDAQLDIKDIFVSEITAQYLSYMEQVDGMDMDKASEFLTMAATLLYIKSRQLLPRPPKEDPEEEEDPEAMLIRQLREYKAFKDASTGLQTLFAQASQCCARLPEDVVLPPRTVQLDGTTMEGLFAAFEAMLRRVEASKPDEEKRSLHHVRADAFTVRTQIGKIRTVLTQQDTVRFEDLFDQQATRMEMIVTFMALLEMINHGEILLRQNAPFAPIRISAGTLIHGEAEYHYMDEETDE